MITHHLHLTAVKKKTGAFLNKETLVHGPRFKSIFSGVGRFPVEPVNIQLSGDAGLIQKPSRHVPMSLKDKFEQEIHSMGKKVSFLSLTVIKQLNSKTLFFCS